MNKKQWKECVKRLEETKENTLSNLETAKHNVEVCTDQLEELDFTISKYKEKIKTLK